MSRDQFNKYGEISERQDSGFSKQRKTAQKNNHEQSGSDAVMIMIIVIVAALVILFKVNSHNASRLPASRVQEENSEGES